MLTTPDDYVNQLYPEDEELQLVIEAIREHGMPEVSVAPAYGRLLTLLVQTAGARNILEIGALGGYSGICLCRGLPADGKLTSLELKEEYAALAGIHLEKAGFKDRVEYRIGPAADSLAALKREGRTFDFFFIDADKENYPLYLEYALELANPGALIAGDNCFLRGRTLNSEKNGPSVQAVRRFNEIIATDERLVSTLLPAYDGLILARVK
ncbi:methyltransferase [Paenibacillus glucanolyticus]|uniref:Methyltransferase n=1 Tax=Paenibacillus glucanolyticus TaxID=59843 RepID=A0A163F273_9BACL|nr:O-methyltransferase [Paenibacillus glucanolyticus]KZS44105.1 methyltransferase [Paenibacillus glucanolyticus]